MVFEFECPRCKGSLCEVHSADSTDPIMRKGFHHFKHTPSLAINELVLGQRVPQVYVICKSCPDSYKDRSYIHCSHCDVFHSGSIFDAFGNWHGLICPDCGEAIPAIENTTATLLRKVASPITKIVGPMNKRSYIEKKKLSQTNKRLLLANPDAASQRPKYALAGFLFGLCMFVVTMIYVAASAVALHFETETILWLSAGALVLNIAGGAIFGSAMYFKLEKKGNPELHLNVREMIEAKDKELLADDQESTSAE